jgi:hypothetical protein
LRVPGDTTPRLLKACSKKISTPILFGWHNACKHTLLAYAKAVNCRVVRRSTILVMALCSLLIATAPPLGGTKAKSLNLADFTAILP